MSARESIRNWWEPVHLERPDPGSQLVAVHRVPIDAENGYWLSAWDEHSTGRF